MNTVDFLNFKSHLSSIPPNSPYSTNIRYNISKKKIDVHSYLYLFNNTNLSKGIIS